MRPSPQDRIRQRLHLHYITGRPLVGPRLARWAKTTQAPRQSSIAMKPSVGARCLTSARHRQPHDKSIASFVRLAQFSSPAAMAEEAAPQGHGQSVMRPRHLIPGTSVLEHLGGKRLTRGEPSQPRPGPALGHLRCYLLTRVQWLLHATRQDNLAEKARRGWPAMANPTDTTALCLSQQPLPTAKVAEIVWVSGLL